MKRLLCEMVVLRQAHRVEIMGDLLNKESYCYSLKFQKPNLPGFYVLCQAPLNRMMQHADFRCKYA
jgi:hypothetical protein